MELLLMEHGSLPDVDRAMLLGSLVVGGNTLRVYYFQDTQEVVAVLYYRDNIPAWVIDVVATSGGVFYRYFNLEGARGLAHAVLSAFYLEFSLIEGAMTKAMKAGEPYCRPGDTEAAERMGAEAQERSFYAQFGLTPDEPDALCKIVDKLTDVGDLSIFEGFLGSLDDDE